MWEDDQVATHYFTLRFLGHATAEHLFEELQSCCIEVGKQGIVQLSMDGPNVNWATYELLNTDLQTEVGRAPLNIGSCGLHVLHNAFRLGFSQSGWEIEHSLSSLYWLFKDSPARREDFIHVNASACEVFPKKFCSHRWVENVPVVERALEVWPHVANYVKAVKSGKLPNPRIKSFDVVASCCDDPLFIVKANIFLSIALEITPFLTKYQTDLPMVPFLSKDLHDTLVGLLDRFIKDDVMEQAKLSAIKMIKVLGNDVSNTSLHKDTSKVNIGFVSEKLLHELKGTRKISDKDVFSVKSDTRKVLVFLVNKLLEKSPIRYGLVRNLEWLNPRALCTNQPKCVQQLTRALQILVDMHHVTAGQCDLIIRQYKEFATENAANENFMSFKVGTDRLDVLFYGTLGKNTQWAELWNLSKKLLLLSHGQASVERGFSINKEVSVQNMSAQTLVAQRAIKDYLISVGGATHVPMSKELLLSASSARQRYQRHLDEEKKHQDSDKRSTKRKAILDEIDDLKAKKARMESGIATLTKSADELAEQAEGSSKPMEFITQFNAVRRSVKEKQNEVLSLDSKLQSKLKDLETTPI